MASVVNGQMGSGVLVSVGGGQALRADAAAAWLAVVAEVRAQFGITLRLTDSYRPYAVQVRIFNERYDPATSGSGPFGDVRWWGGVRYVRMRGASAAVPGTSNHGLGVAVDVTGLGGFTGSAYEHLGDVAPAHGWTNTSGRKIGEAWHWEYSAATDTRPTPAPAQEDDMPTAQEVAQAVWTMALGPTGATPAGPAWAHLIAAREAAAGASAAASSAAAAVGPMETADPHLGPAPLGRFVGDTRTDVMRILDIAHGQTAQIAALPAAIIAALPPAAAGVGVSLEQVEAAVKFALGTLTLKSV